MSPKASTFHSLFCELKQNSRVESISQSDTKYMGMKIRRENMQVNFIRDTIKLMWRIFISYLTRYISEKW